MTGIKNNMDKYQKRKVVAEWLNSKGYSFEIDKDGLWMEDYDFQEHKTKDVIDEIIEFHETQAKNIVDLIKTKIDLFWRFDGDQQHMSGWHEKQDLLKEVDRIFNLV